MQIDKLRFNKKDLGVLSPLEHEVINVLWKSGGGKRVRDVHNIVKRKRKVALTSVAVILDRLYDKKLVTRSIRIGRGGEYYIYSCVCNKNDFHSSVIEDTVNKLIANYGDIAINYFNERFSKKRKAS